MPFPPQPPRPFTLENIEAIQGNPTGVYGLFREETWIYVGSGDIKKRLLEHYYGDNPSIDRENPTHWAVVIMIDKEGKTTDPVPREKGLILELDPICNKSVG